MKGMRTSMLAFTAAAFLATPVMAGTAVKSDATTITVQPVQQVQGEPQAWLHAGVEAWAGENTYQIGFPATDAFGNVYEGHFPISELKFPLDVIFGVVKLNTVLKDKFLFNAAFKKNITEPDDYMEDRDWITESNPSQLDIYSDSEVTRFDGLIVDLDVGYKFLSRDKGWLAAGARLLDLRWRSPV